MRSTNKKALIDQARTFYKNVRYIPTNYDVLFHTESFSSPVTIRKHFGSWSNYLDKAFDIMYMEYENKMFYGGYNRSFSVTLPDVLDPNIMIDNQSVNILGSLTYDELSSKEIWVLKRRWIDILTVIFSMKIIPKIISAERRFLTPYVILDGQFAVGSFDTPHIKNHYMRTSKVVEYLNKNYELINLNGVKKNHIKKAIERIVE